MIWLILFFVLLLADLSIFFLMPEGIIKGLLLIVLSFIIGAIGFSFKDFFTEIKESNRIKNLQKKVISSFNQYVGNPLDIVVDTEGLEKEEEEVEILLSSLNIKQVSNSKKNILILCYYCKKWNNSKAIFDLEKIKQYAELSEIKYAKLNENVKQFLKYYRRIFSIQEDDFDGLLNHFIEHFYKDLQFYPLMKELNQTKNFHETLIKIINEGKLSNYGITKETLKKLERDLRDKTAYEKTFMVLLNKANDEIKDYLRSLPGFSGSSPSIRNIKNKNAKYSLFIVKPSKIKSSKEFIQILKGKIANGSEIIIRIIPLDFINSESYTYPANKSFTNKNLKECYEAIEWFKSGQIFIDSGIWNEIAKSTIGTNELLSLIPFNIFCPGILPSEQAFLIKNYDTFKSKADIQLLTEWKDKNPNYLVECLIEIGLPDYNSEERKYLKVNETNLTDKAKKRLFNISKQIVDGAVEFSKAMNKTNDNKQREKQN